MPDGEQIVVGWLGARVSVLDTQTGLEVSNIREGMGDESVNQTQVAVSSNGDRIASGRDFEIPGIWTRTGNTVAGPLSTKYWNMYITFSPDSIDLVAYRSDGIVGVVNASIGVLIFGPKEFNGYVTSLALSPSITNDPITKMLVAVAVEHQIFIWDTLTGNVTGPFTHHHDASRIKALVFSSDGKYITSAASDHTLCVSDSSSGKAVRGPVKIHNCQKEFLRDDGEPLITVAMTPNGRRVAFMGNFTILLCDVLYKGDYDVVLHCISVLAGHLLMGSATFSRNGQYLATLSNNDRLRTWDVQAALEHKRIIDNLDSAHASSEVFNLDETWIDNDGWATCANGDGANPPLRQLFWVPEIHRVGLRRPSNMCMVGGQWEQLDLENFVHGRNWAKCWRGFENS